MSPADFIRFIECAESQQRLMGRICLCVSGYAESVPVDVSELDKLSPFNRAGVNSFLSWIDWNYGFRLDDRDAQRVAFFVCP